MPRFPRLRETLSNLRQKPLIRVSSAAFGLISIYLLWLIQPATDPTQYAFYHWKGNPTTFFLSVAIDILVGWILLTSLLLLAKNPGRLRATLWSALLLFLPWMVYINFRVLTARVPYHRVSSTLFFAALVSTLAVTVLWRPRFSPAFERLIASATEVLLFACLFGIFLLSKLTWYGWTESPLSHQSALHQRSSTKAAPPSRIIWIVFDELSYRQLYEHRFAGLQLPAFDALARQSTVFTNVVPPDISTEIVLPGLLSGETFDKVKPVTGGQLSVHTAATNSWKRFDQHDTVFQDALTFGYSTALSGWYNPYCRLVPQVLDQCFWTVEERLVNNMTNSGTILTDSYGALKMFSCMALTAAPRILRDKFPGCWPLFVYVDQTPAAHMQDYHSLLATSEQVLLDRSATFTFLPLPIPHPPGIYDRSTAILTTAPSTYVDNLALADRCLAQLRTVLEQSGQWDASTIVIMGDHGWRTTQIWNRLQTWSPEDQQASQGGRYDPRPAYIVKLPGQVTGTQITTPYHSVNTRKLFDQLMAHKINTPAQLSLWVPAAH